ncbi:hypothetical protein C8R43DRAFT_959245 [Mycena crocata]|nr:hypothetical protein C8R43DRAFT_959245 [Mycena crocata]
MTTSRTLPPVSNIPIVPLQTVDDGLCLQERKQDSLQEIKAVSGSSWCTRCIFMLRKVLADKDRPDLSCFYLEISEEDGVIKEIREILQMCNEPEVSCVWSASASTRLSPGPTSKEHEDVSTRPRDPSNHIVSKNNKQFRWPTQPPLHLCVQPVEVDVAGSTPMEVVDTLTYHLPYRINGVGHPCDESNRRPAQLGHRRLEPPPRTSLGPLVCADRASEGLPPLDALHAPTDNGRRSR